MPELTPPQITIPEFNPDRFTFDQVFAKPVAGATPAPAAASFNPDSFTLDQAQPAAKPFNPDSFTLAQVQTVTKPKPAAGTPTVYTPDVLKTKTDAELLADKHFDPVRFAHDNAESLNDPATKQRLLSLYQARAKTGSAFEGVNLKAFPEAVGKGFAALGRFGAHVLPGGSTTPEETVQSGAEAVAAVNTAVSSNKDLLRRSAREVGEGLGKYIPGVNSKADLTAADWESRFNSDLQGVRDVDTASKGNGPLSKALEVDANRLAKIGIKVNPEEVQNLSVVFDPVNFIPVGTAVGAVGKIGGKLATRVIATAVTAEQAAKFASALNAGAKIASEVGDVGASTAGSAIKAVGSGIEKAGTAAEKVTKGVAGTSLGVGLGALLGHDVYSTLGTVALAKITPKVIKGIGGATKAAGEILTGERAVPLAGQIAGGAVKGFAKGVAEGSALALPFYVGATPEEKENLAGIVAFGGLTRAGVEGAAPAAKAAGRGAQNRLAEAIFKKVEQTDAPESPAYQTDHSLDSSHAASVESLSEPEKKLVNWSRELLRNDGGEVYVLPGDEFERRLGRNAGGYAVEVGQKLEPDGTARPLFRILLNSSAEALPHEFYHALESLDPAKAKSFRDTVSESLTPEQLKQFGQQYNARINHGLPENKWTYRLDDNQIASEVAAEVFSRLFLAQDLSGVNPRVTTKAAVFASSLLEKLGAPLGGLNKPQGEAGVSNLGVRPGTESVKAGQSWLQNLIGSVNETGTFGEPLKKSAIAPEASSRPPKAVGIPADVIQRRPQTPIPQELFKAPEVTAEQSAQKDLFQGPGAAKLTEIETAKVPIPTEKTATPGELFDRPDMTPEQSAQKDLLQGVPTKPIPPAESAPIVGSEFKAPAKPTAPVEPKEIKPKTAKPKKVTELPPVEEVAQPLDQPVSPPTEARNIRTTREKQNEFASKRAAQTDVEKARKAAEYDPELLAKVDEVSNHMETGNPPLEIEHSGVKSESTSEKPLGRSARQREQEAAYVAENAGKAPKDLREAHQKVFVPERWVVTAQGKPQLLAWSMDKIIANMRFVAAKAAEFKAADKIPFEIHNGELTPDAFAKSVERFQHYAANQANGLRGDGQKLVRPKGEAARFIPPENPAYLPVRLSEPEMNFFNMVVGLETPLTAKKGRSESGIPGNVKGQIIAEANKRTPQTPTYIRPEDLNKQTFPSGRTIKETNPLRNELAAAGVPVREIIPATERLNAADISKVTPRPDLNFRAPVTDTVRGGFSPAVLTEGPVAERVSKIVDADRAEFAALFADGSLTREAYRLGLGLTDRADLAELRSAMVQLDDVASRQMKAGDFDEAFSTVAKRQFFREALEAATDTGSAATQRGWRDAFPDAVPPFTELKGKFLPASSLPNVDAITLAAVKTPGGKIFTGAWHGEALMELVRAVGEGKVKEKFPRDPEDPSSLDTSALTEGFISRSGKFFDRAEALKHAERIKQLRALPEDEGVLESSNFDRRKNF